MDIVLTREVVQKEVNSLIENFNPDAFALYQRHININNIMKFLIDLDIDKFKSLYQAIDESVNSTTPNSLVKNIFLIELLACRNVLNLIFRAVREIRSIEHDLSEDDKMNLLIELKSKASPDGSEIIISDSLEDDLQE